MGVTSCGYLILSSVLWSATLHGIFRRVQGKYNAATYGMSQLHVTDKTYFVDKHCNNACDLKQWRLGCDLADVPAEIFHQNSAAFLEPRLKICNKRKHTSNLRREPTILSASTAYEDATQC